MTTTPDRTADEIIAVLVAALAVAKGRSESTVRCEFGLDPVAVPLREISPRTGGPSVPGHSMPRNTVPGDDEMLLSA
ncbi:hypothetical protein [Sanguibacter antarcticus]|uniref:Uncharacterized protein n=1 Tax=Sanguibacter antarcticus TaxID=372484 RepID=A0A2A9E7B2_9MICO|nr:hypothetical protein [Sanguibacter antarcticus]PFG34205.1 hypothetical protein ATL42_2110 [Sanguibacter antarcticus]